VDDAQALGDQVITVFEGAIVQAVMGIIVRPRPS
jgi:hypothetical protein